MARGGGEICQVLSPAIKFLQPHKHSFGLVTWVSLRIIRRFSAVPSTSSQGSAKTARGNFLGIDRRPKTKRAIR